MKVRKAAGGLLFGLGCAAAFVGLLATVLPLIDNDQLRLVLSSFAMPSENGIVNAINAVMTYALHNCYAVLLAGLGIMAGGAALLLWKEDVPERRPPQREWKMPVNEDAKKPEVYARPPIELESNPFADFSMQELSIQRTQPVAVEEKPSYPSPILPNSQENVSVSPYARPADEQAEETAAPEHVLSARESEPASPAETFAPVSVSPAEKSARKENKIEKRPVPDALLDAGSRSVTDVRLPAVEAGAVSQSGSKVMIRSTIQTSAGEKKEEASVQQRSLEPAESGEKYTPNEEGSFQPRSPRIKSTMGKHTV